VRYYENDNDDINALPIDEDYVPPPSATDAPSAPIYSFPAPQRSAGLLGWGIPLVLLGLYCLQTGASLTLEWNLTGGRGDDLGIAVTILGLAMVFGGATCLRMGIRRLATSVDYIAFRTHLQEHREL
jgi:hypothetical protein